VGEHATTGVLVKICGLTRARDVDAAVSAGADLVGFVCVADSPRGVTLERARELAARVPAHVRTVAVFAEEMQTRPEGFDLAQVYGRPGALRDTIVGVRGDPPDGLPDGVPVLLDLPRGSRPGGSELRAHWLRASAVREPVILAGSLDPTNVAEAVAVARPWAVDTARGVESAPGIKDHALIERFVSAAKEAAIQ
jgi:phosphoribosylanthranilate isomerase